MTILGNLAGVRAWINAADPPKDYAWFDPSRVIPDTINEFPSFSFVLGDLHAHVLALPFTVLALAFALQIALRGPRGDLRLARRRRGAGGGAGDRRRCTRSTRGRIPVAAGHPGRGGDHLGARGRRGAAAATRSSWLGLVLVASFVLILPFVLNFDPEARGIGFVHVRRPFGKWLGDMALIYGILRGRWSAAFARAPAATRRNRWRWIGWGLAARRRASASLLAADNLTGAMVVAVWMAVGIGAALVAASCTRAAALPLDPDRRRRGAAADPGDPLPQGRVRRLAAVSHEHGLQGRLPGVPAARPGRGLRAAVGGRVAARGARCGRPGRRSPRS